MIDAPRDFWAALEQLVQEHKVVVDRPKGTHHPCYSGHSYPVDYGYLEGTRAADGQGIDVWIGSLPGRMVEAVILTVDLVKRDSEIKLLLGCTPPEQSQILDFLNVSQSMRAQLITRHAVRGWLKARRSVRRFLPHPVDRQVVQRVLEAATWAPSAHNRQPWRFVVLESQPRRERLAQEMGRDFRRDLLADGAPEAEAQAQVERSRQRMLAAPAVVLLCLDGTAGDQYPDPERQQAELLMGVQSVALAGENLLLAAQAEGLGGVWVCAPLFAPAAVQRALALPPNWLPQGLIYLGFPAKIPAMRPRRPVEEVSLFI
jgi:coenzyme F420-0:L-glutamate ligase / coenzyme F420-1:gamma-L-glutamate ligase